MVFLLTIAWASGLDVPAIGTGLSGPAMADAASVYFNPANLTRLDAPQLQLTGGGVVGRVGYRRQRIGTYQQSDGLAFAAPIPEAWVDPTKTGATEPVSATPASPFGNLFLGVPVSDRVAFGFGIYIPYAAPLAFPDDGPQRWALQRAFIAVTQSTLAVAVRPSDAVHLGAGVTYVSGLASISRTVDFAGLDAFGDGLANPPINQPNAFGADAPSSVRELDVLSRPFTFTDGVSHGVDFNVGASVQVGEAWLSAAYHHGSRARFVGDFALDMNDDFFTSDLAAQGVEFVPLVTGQAELSFRLPGRILVGVDAPLTDTLSLELEAAYVLWRTLSDFDLTLSSPALAQPALGITETLTASIPRRWNDSVHIELTPRMQASERSVVLVTVGVHTPASPESTVDVASPDGLRLVGALGGAVNTGEQGRVRLHADAEVQSIVPRTVTGSDYDLANGQYNLLLLGVGVGATVMFQ